MRTTIYIQNLKCKGCEATIISKLSESRSLSEIVVNHEVESVSFDHHSNKDLESVRHILESIGYPLQGEENKLGSKAKSYISCAIGRVKSH